MQRRKIGGTGSPGVSPAAVPKKKVANPRGKNRRTNNNDNDAAGFEIPQGFNDVAAATAESSSSMPNGNRGSPRRRISEDRESNSAGWMVKFGILVVLVVAASYFVVSKHEELQFKKIREEIVHDQVEPLSREWEEKYADLEEENQRLKKYSTLQGDMDKLLLEKKEFTELRKTMEGKIHSLEQYKRKMQQNIQLLSSTMLLEKFGGGPHHVEINLSFDPAGKYTTFNATEQIIVELAPVEEMPHAVYWFLQQVDHKLYDGCSFHRNAPHVLQGGPAPNFLSPEDPQMRKKFKDLGYEKILFQEYSPNFPHQKYTMGLAGRPGGPDFYISKKDNSILHGPGGQRNYADPTEADPCFAKVVRGFEVVDRMGEAPIKEGNYRALEHNIAITSMKIMSEEAWEAIDSPEGQELY